MSIEETAEEFNEAVRLVISLQDVIEKIKNVGNKIDDEKTKMMFAQILTSEILHNLSFSPIEIFGIIEGIKFEEICRLVHTYVEKKLKDR
jgi:hypothetical protein